MILLKRISHIISKELAIEKREKYSFLSALLYLTSISFVVLKLFPDLKGPTRIGIFWILMVFTAILMVGDSFNNLDLKKKLSHYQLYDPVELIIAKYVLNFVKLIIAGLILIGLFTIISNSALASPLLFAKISLLAFAGMVGVLILVSSLTVYSNNQNGLVAILAVPLLLPILLIAMRVSLISEKIFFDTAVNSNLLMLAGIDLLIIALVIGLISFTWKP